MSRISNTVSELRTQLTQQFAKSLGGVPGSARQQAQAASTPGGFTIVELLVATTAFSVVLLLALGSFVRISQLFYKGVVIDRTRIAAEQIMADLRAGFNSDSIPPTVAAPDSNHHGYLCIHNTRYSYTLFDNVDLSNPPSPSNYGLVKDTPSGGGCPTLSQVAFSGPQELLGNKMRLSQLDITPASAPEAGNAYAISLKIAYGDDSALTGEDGANPSCVGNFSVTEFCTVNSSFSALNLGQ